MRRLTFGLRSWILPVALLATLACGCSDSDNLVNDDDTTTDTGTDSGTTDTGTGDGDSTTGDTTAGDGDGDTTTAGDGDGDGDGTPAGCDPDGPQCNNCIDDDGDGRIDGNDFECTAAQDNDEGSFGTAIPGDNNAAKRQDCFFDGDTGPGNDGCNRPTCCFYENPDDCPEDARDNTFPPTAEDCAVSTECAETCGVAAPPGCDCFGCCTVCNGDECADVLARDGCTSDDLGSCQSCVKATDCGSGCNDDPDDCVLCPGQTEEDLPMECTEQACPGESSSCVDNGDCAEGNFCNNGCCALIIG